MTSLYMLFCLVAAAASFPNAGGQYASGGGGGGGNQPGMPYNFEWTVRAPEFGNDYGHAEQSDGNTVQGQYYVLLPDGRRQTVTYTADGLSGFVADVKYEGEAKFPGGVGGGGIGGGGGGGGGGGYN